MKLQTLQILQTFIECRNMVGGASVHISKHALSRLKITVGCLTSACPSIHVETLKITVGCPPCTYPSIRVCDVCVCVVLAMCACSVVYVLRVCVGCAFRVLVLWCAVLCRYVWCWCWCWCAMCGVWCLWCVVSVRVLIQNASVCRFKTSPCVPPKRPCHIQHGRFGGTHGGVLNLHTHTHKTPTTERQTDTDRRLSFYLHLSSNVCLSSHTSLFLSRSQCSSFFLFSMTMTMSTRPVGSLCTHGPDSLLCKSAWVLAHSLPSERVASCTTQLSWQNCANLVPLGMNWACVCAGNGCCVWKWVMRLCLVVFGYVCSCQYVLSSLCCWLRQCWRLCAGCCAVVTVQKKNDVCNFKKKKKK